MNVDLSASVVAIQTELDQAKVEVALIKREAKADLEKAVWAVEKTSSLKYKGTIEKF